MMEDSLDIEVNLMPGFWKHFKGGVYEVLGTAKHSETGEEFAVYKHAGEDKLWVRPVKMFLEVVPGKGPRFRRIEQ